MAETNIGVASVKNWPISDVFGNCLSILVSTLAECRGNMGLF